MAPFVFSILSVFRNNLLLSLLFQEPFGSILACKRWQTGERTATTDAKTNTFVKLIRLPSNSIVLWIDN